jgi:hypothetical protein
MSLRDKLKDAVTTDDAEAADEARRKADEAAAKACLPSATVEEKAQADEARQQAESEAKAAQEAQAEADRKASAVRQRRAGRLRPAAVEGVT